MSVGVFTPHYNAGNAAVLEDFAAGVPNATLYDDRAYVECDVMVIFGLPKRSFAKSHAKAELLRLHSGAVVVIERGFVHRGSAVIGDEEYGDRSGVCWSVGLGGINGRADFRNADVPGGRWAALGVELQPWTKRDRGYALIVGQVPWDTSVQDLDHLGWLHAQVDAARAAGLVPIFRPHPVALRKGVDHGVRCTTVGREPLEVDLKDARVVVTQNSNVGVDAAIAGVPVVATDETSMAWAVSARSIEEAVAEDYQPPGRERWAAELAYAQWTRDEMRAGLPWRHLFR